MTAKDKISEADAEAVLAWKRLRVEIEGLKAQLPAADEGECISLRGEIDLLQKRLARGPIIQN